MKTSKPRQKRPIPKLNKAYSKTLKAQRRKHKLAIKAKRPIHKKVLLHPITVFILLCAGVFVVMWTYRAAAESYQVRAKVSAAPLSQGADITTPLDGFASITTPTAIKGTCPLNSYVVLSRNGSMSGVDSCALDGTFDITTSLYPGLNTLQAQSFNVTDDAGPTTPSIGVTYTAPVVPPSDPPASNGTPSTPADKPTTATNLPVLASSYLYQVFPINSPFSWNVDIVGGEAPYKMKIDWGDGKTSSQSSPNADTVSLDHHYNEAGSFTILITLIDSADAEATLQLIAVVKDITAQNPVDANGAAMTGTGGSDGSSGGSVWSVIARNWTKIAAGSYATVGLMSVSFWLGEHQTIANLVARHAAPRMPHKHI